jgi:hypothetical protein
MKVPGARKARTVIYTDTEADQILAWTAKQPGIRGQVARAVLATLRYAGLRRNEFSVVRLDGVDLDARRLSVVGKGCKPRIVPLPSPLVPGDIKAALYLPRETLPPTPHTPPTEWIRRLEPLGARLAAGSCDCEERTEPRHSLGHVLKFTAEALDAHERGEVELPKGGRELFEGVRDLLIGWL